VQWLAEKLKAQESRDLSLDPVVTIAEINAARDTVGRVCRPIMSKPKPAPPKEEPKAAEPAPAAAAADAKPAADTAAPAAAEPAPAADAAPTEAPNMDVD